MSRTAWFSTAAAAAFMAAVTLAGCNTLCSDGPQGWGASCRAAWYNADQGSRLMPLAWFKALDAPDGAPSAATGAAQPFSDPGYLATFRILPPAAGAALPIGFAVDRIDAIRAVARPAIGVSA